MFRTCVPVLLLAAVLGGPPGSQLSAAGPPVRPRFPALSNDEAWERLPRKNPPLPTWARTLAASLPRTTVAMLQLDHLHRKNNPLGARLAGELRWAAADEIGCDYARRYAEADLRRAGAWDDSRRQPSGGSQGRNSGERAALAFARKLTRAGHTITDSEVDELVRLLGAGRVVAVVHTAAFANFQNRILLALKAEVEPDGPLPPLDVRLDPDRAAKAPGRSPWPGNAAAKSAAADVRPEWVKRDFPDLEKALERQKSRPPRIPAPDAARLAAIPPEARAQASRVVWTRISMGYQPVLTKGWFDCMRAFQQEGKLDPVFFNTMFWVVTRTNECFY